MRIPLFPGALDSKFGEQTGISSSVTERRELFQLRQSKAARLSLGVHEESSEPQRPTMAQGQHLPLLRLLSVSLELSPCSLTPEARVLNWRLEYERLISSIGISMLKGKEGGGSGEVVTAESLSGDLVNNFIAADKGYRLRTAPSVSYLLES